jgi:hypothetical protein
MPTDSSWCPPRIKRRPSGILVPRRTPGGLPRALQRVRSNRTYKASGSRGKTLSFGARVQPEEETAIRNGCQEGGKAGNEFQGPSCASSERSGAPSKADDFRDLGINFITWASRDAPGPWAKLSSSAASFATWHQETPGGRPTAKLFRRSFVTWASRDARGRANLTSSAEASCTGPPRAGLRAYVPLCFREGGGLFVLPTGLVPPKRGFSRRPLSFLSWAISNGPPLFSGGGPLRVSKVGAECLPLSCGGVPTTLPRAECLQLSCGRSAHNSRATLVRAECSPRPTFWGRSAHNSRAGGVPTETNEGRFCRRPSTPQKGV